MENTNIINAAIKGGNIPRNWLYCFNSGCQHHEECIRFRSTIALSGSRTGATLFIQPRCTPTVRANTSSSSA